MNRNENPLVSVVTPVYNGAYYLAECIESVLKQTYQNFDYIIVNNASTDRTLEIAQDYAKKDSRIRVCSNDSTLPIIENHNRAFRLISQSSKYCKVVSGDDWLFPECLEQMVSLAERNPTVGIVGSYQLSGSDDNPRGWQVRWSEIPYPGTTIPGREVCRMQMLGGPYVFGTPTSILYRADLVRAKESFYPNATAEADTSACYESLHVSDFGFVHQVLSYLRVNEKQISVERGSLNSYLPSRLSDLVHYGSLYLTREEQQMRIDEVLKNYYRFLASSVFRFKDENFWEFHKGRLADLGYPLSYSKLALAVSVESADLALNPKATLEKLLKRLSKADRGPHQQPVMQAAQR